VKLLLAAAGLAGFSWAHAARRPSDSSTAVSTTTGYIRPSRRHLASARLHRRARRYRHRARRLWSPWSVSSFADPSAGDNPAGEDLSIRQSAVEALGDLNGSIVVVDPNTGRILTMVNQKLALSSGFIPCSTIKPIVALAALREGIISRNTKLAAEPRMRYYYGTSRIDLAQALAHSSNEFFAKLGEMLGFERVARYAREFGLGQRAGWHIPDESPGVFPPAPPRVGGVGLLASFGQSIEVTPLQMAAVVSAIANGGTLYYLQYPRTPDEIAHFAPKVRRVLSGLEPYLADVRQGMAEAVLDGTARLAYDPDEQIFGKTGTCSENGARLGWFDSFSSQGRPKYTVVVMLRGGRLMFGPHAAEVAGKLYRDLLERVRAGTQARGLLPPAPDFARH
jgi:penicillin-binding protein 2